MFKTTMLSFWIILSSTFNQNQVTNDIVTPMINNPNDVARVYLDKAPPALTLIPVQPNDHILSIDTSAFSFVTVEKSATLMIPNKDITFVFNQTILQDRFFVINNNETHTLNLFLLNTKHPLKDIILEILYDLYQSPHTYIFLYIKQNNEQDQKYLSTFNKDQIFIGNNANMDFYMVKITLE